MRTENFRRALWILPAMALHFGSVGTHASELQPDLACLTYYLNKSTDELKGVVPPLETEVSRIVTVEDFRLQLKLSSSQRSKLADFHLAAVIKDTAELDRLHRLISHICKTPISETERSWLAENLLRDAGIMD